MFSTFHPKCDPQLSFVLFFAFIVARASRIKSKLQCVLLHTMVSYAYIYNVLYQNVLKYDIYITFRAFSRCFYTKLLGELNK